jgi:NAD(P)H-hydrate repair Nnr-like enzyme with NAD(P)H-hydrate epimerase domain
MSDQPDPARDPLLIVDGLIGYSLEGAKHVRTAELTRWANARSATVLPLDAPSGVDVSPGVVYDLAICADATLTWALPKEGLRSEEALPIVRELPRGHRRTAGTVGATPAGVEGGPLSSPSPRFCGSADI